MKNYKILQNRPELSNEQLQEGMDFGKIKVNAAQAKTTVIKSLVIKSVLGVIIVGSGMGVYKMVTGTAIKSHELQSTTSVIKSNPPTVDSVIHGDQTNKATSTGRTGKDQQPLIVAHTTAATLTDTIKKNVAVNETPKPEIIEVIKQEDRIINDSVVNAVTKQICKTSIPKTPKVTNVKICKIWNTKDFCNIPKTAKFATSLDCDLVDFDAIDCQTVNQKNNAVGVWLTVLANEKSTFRIESALNNITLVDARGKSQNPQMIYLNGGTQYYGSHLKARKLIVHYNKQIDIFMVFENAKVGDRILIHKFVEAFIEH
jgi:hypothetical protein